MSEQYRVITGRIAHANGVYREGDVFEPRESTIRALAERKNRIEPVEPDGGSGGEEINGNSEEVPADTDDGTSPDDTEATAESNGADADDGDGSDDDADELDYDSLTVSELKDVLRERDFSADELRDLIEYEESNKDRSGAKKALGKALDDAESESEE